MITAIYAGILALLLVALSGRVARLRGKHQVGIGEGGVDELARAIRVQGNFVEYVPLVLVLMLVLEGAGAVSWALHVIGIALVVCRLAHAQGLTSSVGVSVGRFVGTAGTFALLIVCGVWAILIGAGIG